MVQLKRSNTAPNAPKPKYGHLSELDPAFLPLKQDVDDTDDRVWALPLDEFREEWLKLPPALFPDSPLPGTDIEIEDRTLPVRDGEEISIRVYRPTKPQQGAALYLKVHGGGWVIANHQVEEAENRAVAGMGGVVVASVEYRKGPEHKFPTAINDCFDALKWCKLNASSLGINPERILIGGGSAGGNMIRTAVLALLARNENLSGILGQVVNIPVTCHPKYFPADKYEYGSYSQNKDAHFLNASMMDWFWEQYAGTDPAPDWRHSPLLAGDLHRLPPALIQVAGADPLRDEGLAYAEALQAAGNEVTLKVYKGLPHAFYLFPQLKAAGEYIAAIKDFVSSVVNRTDGVLLI